MSVIRDVKRIIPFVIFITISLSLSNAQEGEGDVAGSFNEISDFADIGNPDLDFTHVVKARGDGKDGVWTIHVTLIHGDTGWNHYADRWQIVDRETGAILGERILLHPHENEQPFTRSLSGIIIGKSVKQITIRGACQVHGFGGTELIVDL